MRTKTKDSVAAENLFEFFNKLVKCCLSFIFVFLLFHGSLFSQVNARYFLNAGRVDLSEDRNTEAIRNFNTAIAARPDHFEAWFFRGIAKFNLNDYTGSLADFTETIRLHPLYARAYHYRGIVNDRLTNYYDAKADFRKALEIDPYNADLFVAAGATDMHLNDFEAAVKNYDMALIIFPQYADAYLNRGVAKHILGKSEEALVDLGKAINSAPYSVEAWLKRSMLRTELKQFDAALDDLTQALKLDRQNPLIYFQRAQLMLQKADTLSALNDFEQVNILDPRNALTYYNRALLHSIRNELPEAKALYRQVILINPSNIYSHFNLGIVNYKMELYSEADDNFTAALQLFPGFVGAMVNRSLVRKAMKKNAASQADYDQAMALIQKMNQSEGDPDDLFGKFADSTYFNTIIALEADFINGNSLLQRPQFRKVDIQPFGNITVAFAQHKNRQIENSTRNYSDLQLSQLNAELPEELRLAYRFKTLTEATFDLQKQEKLIETSTLTYSQKQLILGVLNQERNNLSRAIEHYSNIPEPDSLAAFALLNQAVAHFNKEENRIMENEYVEAVTIQKGTTTNKPKEQEKDLRLNIGEAFTLLEKSGRRSAKNAFVAFNKGNMLLQTGAFHPAIDAYSDAIAFEPSFGEAYYNRALTLLYLNEKELACSDLSHSGENGITESYAVIRKYCSAK